VNESLVTEDFQIWGPTMGTLDMRTYKKLVAGLNKLMPVLVAMTIVGTTAEGDRVAVEAAGSTRLADGRVYENTYHILFQFRNGRIRMVKEYLDSKRAADIFGSFDNGSGGSASR
jgi:ketosteroid isomerase-like protein